MMGNIQGELLVMKTMGIRPNFTELERTYIMDYRIVIKINVGKRIRKVGMNNESFCMGIIGFKIIYDYCS